MSNRIVTVSLGYTKNLGGFDSAKVNIGFQDEIRPGETEEETFARVYKFCEDKLIEKITEMEQELKGK
jgi:hypothetical protein